jgi:hypothetical protein
MPVYKELPSRLKAAVPLLLAQVVYHYHRGNQGMNKRHRLFTSPLWTTHQTLRHELFNLLRGADTGQASVLKETYRDKRTDEYQWIKEMNERTKEESNKTTAMKKIQVQLLQRVAALERRSVYEQQLPEGAGASNDADLADANLQASQGSNDEDGMEQSSTPNLLLASKGRESSIDSGEDSTVQKGKLQKVKPNQGVVLACPSSPLKIEDGITVEQAWDAWHGTTESVPWKHIGRKSPCLPTNEPERRETGKLLSKIKILMQFVQGNLSHEEVEKDVSSAWNACQRSAKQALQQAGSEWILAGSIRTAYNKYCAFRKKNSRAVESMERRKVDLVQPEMRQPNLHAYWDNKGGLIDASEVQNISDPEFEGEDRADEEEAVEPGMYANLGQKICFICPHCPDTGRSRDYVVYCKCSRGGAKTLWQHWDREHKGQPKPALWKVHQVMGMKLESSRTAPWVRVEHAASFRHEDYDLLTMREEVLAGRRVLQNGTFVELQPTAAERNKGTRWFAAIRDGRVSTEGQITVQWCEDNCQQLAPYRISRVYIESIIRVSAGEGRPFQDVP